MFASYDLKVGYSCNNNCIHCVIKDSQKNLVKQNLPIDLTTDECLNLLYKAISEGINGVTITGGEPTIRKDLPQLIDVCLSHQLVITLQTNGRKLSNEKQISYLLKPDGIIFVIALHGVTANIHDAITRSPGSFLETLEGIRTVVKANKEIVIKTVISKINMEQLPQFILFMKKEGLKNINVAFPHAQGAARENFEMTVPRYIELRPYVKEMAILAKKENINLTFETIPFCILPEHPELMGELTYQYKKVTCTQVYEDTFDWNTLRPEIKKKSPKCNNCIFNNYCEGVWVEYAEKYGFNEFSPVQIAHD